MSEQSKVSTLLDEFSGDRESISALDEVLADVNQQYKMRRYQMIGEAMRHELPERVNTDFSAGVMSAVNEIEPLQIEPQSGSADQPVRSESRTSVWVWPFLKPVAGMAIAASVAIVSVTLWQSVNIGSQSGQVTDQLVSIDQQKIQQLASQPVQLGAATVSAYVNDGMRWKVINGNTAMQQKLNAYLVNHTEYSNSMQGLIPQVRVAGFDSKQ